MKEPKKMKNRKSETKFYWLYNSDIKPEVTHLLLKKQLLKLTVPASTKNAELIWRYKNLSNDLYMQHKHFVGLRLGLS